MPHFTTADMAQRDRSREYPATADGDSPRAQYPPHPQSMDGGSPHSQYQQQPPPPPGDDRSRQSQPPVTLPPMRDPNGGYAQQQPGYPGPPPAASNGYAPPPPGANGYTAPPQNGQAPLPHLQPPQADSRSPTYPPPADPRDEYYAQRRPPPYDRDAYYAAYRGHPPPPDYYGRGQPPPPPHDDYHRGHPPPRHEGEFRPPHPYEAEYANGHPRNGYPYPQGGPMPSGPQLQQAAPRQRTSIACRYCRKRKVGIRGRWRPPPPQPIRCVRAVVLTALVQIRCSGYQNAPGGRCINCTRMNQECIFQPVSSSSTAAFVHVSAVPGGITPGTPLYGAYGQPLPGGGGPSPQGAPPQVVPYPPPHVQNAAYFQPVRSPTDLNSPYSESDAVSASGRRRRRESEDGHERRPPPPPGGAEDEAWRRSPVSSSNSPRSAYYPSQPPLSAAPSGVSVGTHTPPVSSSGRTPPQRSPAISNSGGASNGREGGRSGSSTNGTTPTPTPGAGPSGSVMSVKSILGDAPASDIDKSMLGRLNRGVR